MVEAAVARLGATPFAVIDLETTGIYAGGHDRVVEVAIIRADPSGVVIDEYTTLVNPRRDIGPSPIHGIMAEDVLHAPVFEEIAGDVADRLDGAILAAHNLRFELGFIGAELERCGIALPPMPAVCTLHLAFRICPTLPSRKLGWCCEEAGIRHEDEHNALGDARATAALLSVYLRRAMERGWRALPDLGCDVCGLPHSSWRETVRPSGKRLCRSAAAERAREGRTYLARLVERLAGQDTNDPRTAEYLSLVDRVLEDRIVTQAEAEGLVAAAVSWGMTREDVLAAHRVYLSSLVTQALSDGVVSPAERRDLEAVCDMLGLHRAALEELLAGSPRASRPASTSTTDGLAGKTVCFTGELCGRINGAPITREQAEEMAVRAGLVVKSGVTKKLDVLVCADAHSQSGKAKKAREYGVRIMAEPAFWRALGITVE
jgi:DNA polymerase III epsilon subunit-like protein